MSEHIWYDQGWLPPVGERVVIVDPSPHEFCAHHVGQEVEILAHTLNVNYDPVAVYHVIVYDEEDGFVSEFHGLVRQCFRPQED